MQYATSSIFHIVGTGTDVGKTFVTGLLLEASRQAGISAMSVKPVHSGWPRDEEWGGDLQSIRHLWTHDASPREACAYHFHQPVSPHFAAYSEDRQIDPVFLSSWTKKCRLFPVRRVFIEGIGGICCPLASHFTYLDYMIDNPAPVILVSSVGLGSLNHAIMSTKLLLDAGLPILGVVLNEERNFAADEVPAKTARWELERQLDIPLYGPLPRGGLAGALDLLAGLLRDLPS